MRDRETEKENEGCVCVLTFSYLTDLDTMYVRFTL